MANKINNYAKKRKKEKPSVLKYSIYTNLNGNQDFVCKYMLLILEFLQNYL